MKNGSRSNGSQTGKLSLIDRHGHTISLSFHDEDSFAEYQPSEISAPASDQQKRVLDKIGQIHQAQLIAFAAASIGCAAAAVAAGSYALWLSRRKVTGEALLSVHDLLETCRERVSRMEAEMEAELDHSVNRS